MSSKSTLTVGIDVGGTFTDLIAIDTATNSVKLAKVPTTIDNQAIGFMAALAAAGPRLQAYLDRRGGAIVDEPATAEALATVVLRGLGVDAFTLDDVLAVAPGADITVLRKLKERTLS